MKGKIAATVCLALTVGVPGTVRAQAIEGADKYQITAEEMSACGSDAIALCSFAYPDESKLLSCMKQNRVNLSASCRPVFEAGVRRRHL